MEEKTCPIRLASGGLTGITTKCLGVRCEWYVKTFDPVDDNYNEGCAIKIIARSLQEINEKGLRGKGIKVP